MSTSPSTVSFEYHELAIRTLSTNGVTQGSTIRGSLFLPDLSTDTCRSQTEPYVNKTATTLKQTPRVGNFHEIAFAPWTSSQCIYEYLESARQDPQLKAFIFFVTDNNSTATPPAPSDPMWHLEDGGNWKSEQSFAIYAVSNVVGSKVMEQLAAYSGNLTTVPYGHDLAEQIDASEWVRLIASIQTSGGNRLPSLWVFLLIILGLLVAVICISSFVMHWLQSRRRNNLRSRVIRGEVDLEALGIRRLTVPQEVLNKMPLYIYTDRPATPPAEPQHNPTEEIKENGVSHIKGASQPSSSPEVRPATYCQPTCAICLDDFVAGETSVRELPCRHIYHPECIDSFLRDNSSLCPLCKTTVLPKGYCPAVITNAMVRRERWVRRIRSRAASQGITQAELVQEQQRMMAEERYRPGLLNAFAIWTMGNRPSRREQRGDVEMQRTSPSTADAATAAEQQLPAAPAPVAVPAGASTDATNMTPVSPRPERGTASRREWARQRALALLGRHRHHSDLVDEDEEPPRGRMRKALSRVFPGV
ncbi:uncharacterized protein K452DRAFT_327886 [Aplosporella prunicola CBS 121167]|uniref:RING-type domain-containing protein n=1 Tax=Aplosporella prunicola CBS 121167 TaxID=1176127 RepID=A0A6A6BAN1_9PEZI|nr:uncharacterized protein K452DRAFT_327886 [Aplosporella prunicola CBS 121167]KAF2139967.1 hypothetical protein K452DRAFT_327886 [Aplosporella prunicola CBS 121167]